MRITSVFLVVTSGPLFCGIVLAYRNIPTSFPPNRVCVVPEDPEAYARALYAQLHACDQAQADWILVEAVPQTAAWSGIADRLCRAAVD